MSRLRRKSKEVREVNKRFNAVVKSMAALDGKRVHSVLLNTDEVVTIVLALHKASLWSYLERDEACRLAQRIYKNKDSEWLKNMFAERKPAPTPTAIDEVPA